jgi:integrase
VKYGSGAGVASSLDALGLDLRLILELPLHLADMAQFSVATGLRQANVTRLQRKQISLERRHFWVSATDHKNGRPHSVPLNQAAMDVLDRRQGYHPTHVFTYEGNPIVQVNTRAWHKALERAGSRIFCGMTCGIPLPLGTGKQAR